MAPKITIEEREEFGVKPRTSQERTITPDEKGLFGSMKGITSKQEGRLVPKQTESHS
jgi:hypothetical protein